MLFLISANSFLISFLAFYSLLTSFLSFSILFYFSPRGGSRLPKADCALCRSFLVLGRAFFAAPGVLACRYSYIAAEGPFDALFTFSECLTSIPASFLFFFDDASLSFARIAAFRSASVPGLKTD